MNKTFTISNTGITLQNRNKKASLKYISRLLFFIFFIGFYADLIAQITVTNANAGNGIYSSLTKAGGAFQAINATVQTGANINISISGNVTDENGVNGLNNGAWASITINSVGNNNISGDVAGSLINFNGADNVTINGGSLSGSNTLSIENISTSNTASTVQFIHDALANRIKYCSILGSSTNLSGGTIHFRGTASTVGNDNNTIEYCNISAAGFNTPNNGVFASGSPVAGKENDNNSILNCNISNYFSATKNSYGVYIIANNNAWTIRGNHFFQTTAITAAANVSHGAIAVLPNANGGFNISDNVIGYSNGSGTGTYVFNSAFDSRFLGIQVQTGAGVNVNNIEGNTISAIDITTNSANSLATGFFSGIAIISGNASVGAVAGNIIGAVDGNGAINIFNNSDAGLVNAIYTSSIGQINISNNKIGSIKAIASGANGIHFNGITSNGTGSNLICSKNEVGGSAVNSIQLGVSGITFSACTVKGIFISATSGINTVELNTIKNITSHSLSNATASTIRSIECSRGVSTVQKNVITEIRYDGSTVTGMGNVGILMSSTSASGLQQVSENSISNLSVTTTTLSNVTVSAINIRDVVIAMVNKNKVFGLTNKSTGTLGFVNGIWASFSTDCSIYNNMISLDNGSNTNGVQLAGIFDNGATAATSNYWYNSVVIAGAQGAVSANSVCFQKAGSNMVNLRNNILLMKRTGAGNFYAIANNNLGGSWSSDHNVIYASNAATTAAWGFPPSGNSTFAVWQSVSSGDANSYNVEPVFTNISVADLTLDQNQNCIIAGKGVAIPSVTDDYFGTIRINPSDIGAHEFATTYTTWIGNSSDWTDKNNWCGKIPTATINVFIPSAVTNFPVINSGIAGFSNNININAGAYLTINNTGSLTTSGNFSNSGNLIIRGEIALNGNAAQSFPGSNGIVDYLNKLTVNNTSGQNPAVVFDANFAITGVLQPQAGIIDLTNITVTLRSNADSTARVSAVTGGFTYSADGKFEVERYYPASRSWRLVTAPLFGTGTIFDTWQNAGNNVPGIGTLITGNPIANGLDPSTDLTASMKKYNFNTQSYEEVLNTVDVKLSDGTGSGADNLGYFLWVRGDRNLSTLAPPVSSITTLKSNGRLQTGLQNFAASGTAGNITLVGNPYVSPINFNSLTRDNLVKRFYTWDPRINKVGGYVVVDNWDNAAAYLKDVSPSSQDVNIQSSQAFFVVTDNLGTAASLSINESDKSAVNNNNLFRPTAGTEIFRSSLHSISVGNIATFADANVASFDNSYNKTVDLGDAAKLTNINENFGLITDAKVLAIERRPILTLTDTLFFDLTQTSDGNYRFVFEPTLTNANNLMGVLEDLYLNTNTDVSLASTTVYDFNISAAMAGSGAANRFRIVFKPINTTPVTFSSVKAWQQQKNIMVEWKVENELNIADYEVEKSRDGYRFTKVYSTPAAAGASGYYIYNWMDVNPVTGDHFYRIKNIGRSGIAEYSQIVKVTIGNKNAGFVVYPNPIKGNTIGMQFNNQPEGMYRVNLVSISGEIIQKMEFKHYGGNASVSIRVEKPIESGTYILQIIQASNQIENFKIIVNNNN